MPAGRHAACSLEAHELLSLRLGPLRSPGALHFVIIMPAHRECQRHLSVRAPAGAPAGPPELQPGDIPTSAVDFHVSDIAPALLATCPPVAAAAAAAAAATPGTDPEERLRRAMWRAPTSISNSLLPLLCFAAGVSVRCADRPSGTPAFYGPAMRCQALDSPCSLRPTLL